MYCNSMSCCMPFTLHRIHYVESMSCSSMSCNSMSCPIPVLYVEFDFLQFDLKSTNFEDPKKTSNKIRRIVNSVISVYKEYKHTFSFLEGQFISDIVIFFSLLGVGHRDGNQDHKAKSKNGEGFHLSSLQ